MSAYSALNKIAEVHYDLILMDIGLGEGPDGFDVTKQIKNGNNINSQTPVVAVTSHTDHAYLERALAVGIERYLSKPFTPNNAQEIVEYIRDKYKI